MRMSTEVEASGDSRERTPFFATKPTFSGHVFVFYLKREMYDAVLTARKNHR